MDKNGSFSLGPRTDDPRTTENNPTGQWTGFHYAQQPRLWDDGDIVEDSERFRLVKLREPGLRLLGRRDVEASEGRRRTVRLTI